MSDDATIALKAFKEGQKGKHHPIWGVKDVEDAWYAGIAWQKEQTHKHSSHECPRCFGTKIDPVHGTVGDSTRCIECGGSGVIATQNPNNEVPYTGNPHDTRRA